MTNNDAEDELPVLILRWGGLCLLIMFAFGAITESLGSRGYFKYEPNYNQSVPAGMSRAESNYIGNTAIENGYNESEAKQIRSAINKFNQAQRNK